MNRRRSPYTWVTWITGILSGDDSCRWSAWAKSQFNYTKRPDQNAEKLATWKAEHADLVAKRVRELKADGWAVTVEDQNKITLEGRATTLACAPDIVATKGIDVLVSDGKTGERKGKDIWQVRVYQLALFLSRRFQDDRRYLGEVVYKDGIQPLGPLEPKDRERIVALLSEVGGAVVPERVPSARECAYCNIDACQDRAEAPAALVAETSVF